MHLGLLVLRNAPFDAIIGRTNFESMLAILEYGHQQVFLTARKKEVLLPLFSELSVVDVPRTYSEDFTFAEE